ncbi:MAG: hypothetical protein AAF680_01325 [Pseudomonadota bacterium]
MTSENKITVENINTPGQTARVNAAKYREMKRAFLNSLTCRPPGLTQKEILETVKKELCSDLFPEGKTSGWWAKTVQLDLEAKGLVAREASKPLRWYRVTASNAIKS